MLRFKHFSGSGFALEQSVNVWLEEFEPDITQMTHTMGPDGSLILCFLFEESFRAQERRLSLESGMANAAMPAVPPQLAPDEPLKVADEPIGPATNLP